MRYFFLGLLGCCMWLGAQNKTVIPVDLQWTGAERWSIGDSLSTEVIGLERAAYLGEHHLPYYQYEWPAGEAGGYVAEVKNPVLVPVAADELALLAGADLPQEPVVSIGLSGSRGQWLHRVSVFPFVEQEGRAMKLQSFDLELTRTKQAEAAPSNRSIHAFADQSVLSQGRFVKVRVTESGLYKLTYADLRSAGIDPANVRLFGYGGAVQDEDFSRPWHDDLPEVAVYDTGDAILFYAQGVNKWTYDETARKFTHEINPYSTYGYYFVTSDNVGTRKRIASREAVTADQVHDVDVFTDYAVYEQEQATITNSGRKLYESITSGSALTASFSFPNLCTDSLVQVRASAARNGSFSLRLNSGASQSISASGYTDRNYSASSGNLSFSLSYSGSGVGYLDYIEVNVWRDLTMTGAYMTFHNRDGLGGYNRYRLNAGSSVRVWDINDLTNVAEVPLTDADGVRTFVDDAFTAKSYVAVDLSAVGSIPSATLVGEVSRQNLHGMASADMLIITHSAFRAAAEALAQAHEQDGLAVAVVTADEVYNEFSSGTPDATAYRRVAKMLYEREDISLRYLLLMGKGSFDNRGLLTGAGSRMLLTYQSVNSVADDKESYTTDDYFGYLDDNEGTSLGSGDLLDVAIGRLPVATADEAWAAVNKTIQYMRNETPGAWKNQLCFLGDDADNNNHMTQANGVADLVAGTHRAYNINKIMLDSYQQEVNASGQSYPLAKNRFNNLIRMGLLYMNYMGHANVNGWSDESILLTHEAAAWTNQYLPLISAGTCEFSRYDREHVCGGEVLLTNAGGGAIGCFSATRSVYPAPNYSLMLSFAEHLFANADVADAAIGDAVMQAKNAVTTDAANKLSYVYFGDPAVRLNYPDPYEVAVQEVDGHAVAGADTLRALSETTLRAVVLDEAGQQATRFNGTVQLVVYDKEETVTCFNNDRETTCDGCSELITPFTYRDRPNTIFKGTAQVSGGEFTITFKLPKDIKYNYGSGRMVFTAWDDAGSEGGQGYFEQFTVGGSSDDAAQVTTGPQVQMYLNYPGFVSGGQVNETPVFTAHVYDEHGINLSSPTPGHDIMLMLDDNQSFVLNDYYESALGTYKEGTVSYQLPTLDDGRYTLMFRVWNLYNVSTMQYLDFEVVTGLTPEILSVRCYPNPATTETTIQVTHDREGEIVDMTVDVYDLAGKLVWTQRQQATDRITWDLTAANGRLAPGLYLYRVSVQMDDKIISSRANKLIVR